MSSSHPTWRSRFRLSLVTSLIGVALTASVMTMVELDRLVAQVVTPAGDSWAVSTITGFTPWRAAEAWQGWSTAPFAGRDALIRFHTAADIVFIVASAIQE